jgi:hypothetical protein
MSGQDGTEQTLRSQSGPSVHSNSIVNFSGLFDKHAEIVVVL